MGGASVRVYESLTIDDGPSATLYARRLNSRPSEPGRCCHRGSHYALLVWLLHVMWHVAVVDVTSISCDTLLVTAVVGLVCVYNCFS